MENGSPKIYTRTGDKGKTSLVGGMRVSKASTRLDAYGTVDELNSTIGVLAHDADNDLIRGGAQTAGQLKRVGDLLHDIQNILFVIGSRLASEDKETREKMPALFREHVTDLEEAMDEFSKQLTPLKNFILPGGCRSAAMAQLARCVCRRAERDCVLLQQKEEVEDEIIVYLNRLSDFLFVLGRHLNRVLGEEETVWAPHGKK